MPRKPRPLLASGSEHWLRLLVNNDEAVFDSALRSHFGWPETEEIKWLSPLASDEFAEYSDREFLCRIHVQPATTPLESFWPRRGACWDGLGSTSSERRLLVEAKAHLAELNSNPTGASGKSLRQIRGSLNKVKAFLGSACPHDWSSLLYQYTNRLAHLYFLRELNSLDAYLVLVYFVGAPDVPKATSVSEWRAANRVIKDVLGIGPNHPLAPFVAEIYVEVPKFTAVAQE